MRYKPSRRLASNCSATTRRMMLSTAFQLQRKKVAMVVLSERCASQATTSSKSRECHAPGRAHATFSVTTLAQRRHSKRRMSASSHTLVDPASRWRHRRLLVS